MNKTIKKLLKITAILAGSVVALLVLVTVLLNTPSVHRWLVNYATEALSEKLNTKVSIEQADINVWGGRVNLYGMNIDDREQRKLLQLKELSVHLDLMKLMDNQLIIKKAAVVGLDAAIIPKTDSTEANFQFIIDAFKKPKTDSIAPADTTRKKQKMELDISSVKLQDIHINWGKGDARLLRAESSRTWSGKHEVEIEDLIVKTDNHKPRKNTGKPKRGWFDVGHLDITANARLTVDPTEKDSLRIELQEATAVDTLTGIDIRDLRARAVLSGGVLHLQDINVQQVRTVLNIQNAVMQLPNKKKGKKLSFETGPIKGTAILQDIARPFSKALANFRTPLDLSLTMSGNDSTLYFHNVNVNTQDKTLTIKAKGDISGLKKKKELDVHFRVNSMNTSTKTAEKIINQFVVKKFMMKQLHNLGSIRYTGDFHVIYRREQFGGTLATKAGNLNFFFEINDDTKYISGRASSRNLNLGKVMEIKKLGNIEASATFKIDIDKKRTLAMRRKKGGKLPIGTVFAKVDDSSYAGVHVRHLTADIRSDGAEAVGDVKKVGSVGDIAFTFYFTDTNEMHKMRIKHSKLKIHWPWEKRDKDDKAEKKKDKKKKAEDKKKPEEKKKKKKFLGIF